MLGYLLAIAIGASYFSMRSTNYILRVAAAAGWLGVMSYLIATYDAENWIVIAILGCVGMATGMPLSLLQSQIDRKGKAYYGEGGDSPSTFRRFLNKINDVDNPEQPSFHRETADEYRAKAHHALGRDRKRR